MFFSKSKPQQNPQEVLAELRKILRRAENDAVDAGAHLREIVRAFEDTTQNVKMQLARQPCCDGQGSFRAGVAVRLSTASPSPA